MADKENKPSGTGAADAANNADVNTAEIVADPVDVEEILAKYDKESAFRRFSGWFARVVALIAIAFSFFQLYTAAFGVLAAQLQRSIHLGFALVLVFILYPVHRGRRRRMDWWDVALALLGLVVTGYIVWNLNSLLYRAGDYTRLDMVIGGMAILWVLEATRRVVGLPIVIIAGIMGIPLGVSSTFIFLFILFGAFLEKTGIGKFFIDLANAVAGGGGGFHRRPAHAADYGGSGVSHGGVHRDALSSDCQIRGVAGPPVFYRHLDCGAPGGQKDRPARA